jgi:inner membrane transporter RhtA
LTKQQPSRSNAVSGAGLLLLGALLIQWSAAIVIPAFHSLGASATSGWRFLLGSVVLLLAIRPKIRNWTRGQWASALALGVSVAVMNQCFYQAISRIPLGGAVAIEYLGPFTVALLGKRSWRHTFFCALAIVGVVSLTRPGSGLTITGVLYAAGSGAGWAAYVFASHRVGVSTKGFDGLAVSMTVAALVTSPLSLPHIALVTSHPTLLVRLSVVATMSIALGFAAELQALRRLRPSMVGVLMALDPAIAFIVGLVLLHQHAALLDVVGVLCVVLAGAGVTYDSSVGLDEVVH